MLQPASPTVLEAERDHFILGSFDRALPVAAGNRIRIVVNWLVFLLIVMGGLSIRVATMTAIEDLLWVLAAMAVILGPTVLLWWSWGRWRLWLLPLELRSVVRRLRSLPHGGRVNGSSPRLERAIDAIRSLGPGIDGMIGTRASAEIQAIEAADLLLEPEPLADGGRPTWDLPSILVAALVFIVLPGFYLTLAMAGGARFPWLSCGLPMLVVLGLMANGLPWFTRWRRRTVRDAMRDVVGPGFLVSGGRIWSRESSVLVLHRPAWVGWKVEAMLLGPAGIRRFRFHNRHDQDLIRFMTHWCHRSPRPDLASGVLASLDLPD